MSFTKLAFQAYSLIYSSLCTLIQAKYKIVYCVKNTYNNGYIQTVKVNYDDYKVNQEIVHHIDEDFENKKVCGYIFGNSMHIKISSWANLYVDICNRLITMGSSKFNDTRTWFKGIKPYISYLISFLSIQD